MKKAKIYKPAKSAMQSGNNKSTNGSNNNKSNSKQSAKQVKPFHQFGLYSGSESQDEKKEIVMHRIFYWPLPKTSIPIPDRSASGWQAQFLLLLLFLP